MINKDNWEETKKRYIEYWTRENHDRPLICVRAPKKGGVLRELNVPEKLEDRWLNTEYVIEASRNYVENTYFGGEAYPMIWPNLGPDVFGSFYGIDLMYGKETSWAIHRDNYSDLVFDEHSTYKKIKEMTKALVEDSKGDYIVGITDIHSGLDALVSIIGPEKLCLELYDNEDQVKRSVFKLLDGFKKVVSELHEIITEKQEGSANWLGPWHPDLWYTTSCDFSCMVSKEMFNTFIMPELIEEIKYLDASIYHLDGPLALKHLDALLSIEKLKGIQWVPGAGQPGASHWIDVLKQIQDAGKLIHMSITSSDLKVLLENLKPEGVLYDLWVSSEEEAKEVIRYASRRY